MFYIIRLLDSKLLSFLPSIGINIKNFSNLKKNLFTSKKASVINFFNNWILSTNHKKIAIMYFIFVIIAGFTGLILATIIRIELAYPGQSVLFNNAEKYLTVISIHGIVMVFFLVIPVIFGAFGNFLLPTQLGIRDVAFPRLNSFMFWFTPAGFVLLLHILFFDKSYNLTYYINYSDLRIQLRNRFFLKDTEVIEFNKNINDTVLALRLKNRDYTSSSSKLLFENASSADFVSATYAYVTDVISSVQTLLKSISPTAALDLIATKLLSMATCLVAYIRLILDLFLGTEDEDGLFEDTFEIDPLLAVDTFFFNFNFSDISYDTIINSLKFDVLAVSASLDYKLDVHLLTKMFVESFQRDSLYNWRLLKFERETWRSLDDFGIFKKNYADRTRFYTGLFEPETLISRVSIWLPNHLIPGWAFITPYSSRLLYTSVGKVDIALVVVLLASLGSVFSAVNYLITYRYIAAPIYKNRKELRSFFVDALLVASRMMLLANPALIIGIILLLSDRHFGTSVFDFSGGGDTILFQHLFWFFGHPEVYIIVIPCFGFLNSILPYYLKKRLSGRLSLQFSMYTIAFMGFAVWGHHMYMVGLANSVRSLYSTMTVMISVPASTKILHWCVTLINTSFSIDVTVLFLLAFMYFFVLGGLSGMFLAHIGFDILFHDTFFVIGHFHVMLAGAVMSCVFGAFYFYFSAIFGIAYNRVFAYLHFFFYFFGQVITLTPMFWLGYCGMPRRVMDYPESFGSWQSIISSGHLLIFLSIIFFLFMLIFSFLENSSNVVKTKGVGRLNTRLSFYTYEMRKTRYKVFKNLYLNKNVVKKDLVKLELNNYEYTFKI